MRRTWLIVGATAVAACGNDAAPAGDVVVRDSAGIVIVENGSPAWGPDDAWTLSAEPVMTIGVAEGPEEYQLFQANAAIRLPSGNILVANSGTYELRFYDSTGAYLHAVGREGAGPGEYRSIERLSLFRGDSIVLFDIANSRMAVLGPDGGFGRTFQLAAPPQASPGLAAGPFADGSFLAESYTMRESGMEPGLKRYHALYGRFDADGALLDTLVRRPSWEFFAGTVAGRSISTSQPFGRTGVSAVAGDRWYYGSADTFEIEVYTLDGQLTHVFRCAIPNRPITAEIADEYVRRVLERQGPSGDAMRRWWAAIPLPETMPAYDAFLVDDVDNLWVREYRRSGEQQSWVVFDPEGRFLGTVAMPTDDGYPTHIGADFVLGTWNTDMDVEQVRMYQLNKGVGE